MGLLAFFKPAPHTQEIENPEEVKKQYKYWRLRIFLGMYVGYAFYYFTRKSFAFAMPGLMVDLGLDKGQLGILASILSVTYGISKFLSGILSDRSNPRYFMAFGLILTGLFNIFFGFSSSILLFAVFWGFNGLFQGWGWPPCARLLTHWYSQNERGTWWGFWSTSQSLGGAITPLVVAFCTQWLGWRFAMFVPGVLCILVGFFIMYQLRDTPQSLGLPSIEKFRNEPMAAQTKDERELSVKEILFKYVLGNKYIWVLSIAYFFVYVIRVGISDWSVVFLVETKGYSLFAAGACVCWFEIGGFLGSLTAGWASDKIFKGRRGPINVLCSIFLVGAICAFWNGVSGSVMLSSCYLFVIGFLLFGPQMLIGMAATELSHKKASGTASGFVGWIAYLGAASAGYPLGKITQEFGWFGFFATLACCGALCLALLLPLWGVTPQTVRKSLGQKEESSTVVSSS